MQAAQKHNSHSKGFPTYLEYQCERLIPVAKILLGLSIAYLVGFVFIDFFQYREQIQTIMSLRFLAALPLMLLLTLLNKPDINHDRVPFYFLSLGLVSFAFYLAMNLSVPDKKDIVVLVPLLYILAVMAMAPLFNTFLLLLCFILGALVYYLAGYFFIDDKVLIDSVFSQMMAIILFTLIAVFKIKQSAEENYELAKSLHWRSHHDTLTQVFNRRGVFAWIDDHKLFKGQSFEALSLAMVDLDHFKQVNDKHGHAVGDDVIIESTQLIRDLLGENSTIARFGGEEFLVVLLEGSDAKNLSCAKKILQAFRHHPFKDKQNQPVKVTVSIGYVNHRQPNSFEDTLKMSDKFLYQAKHKGRDQLIDGKKQT